MWEDNRGVSFCNRVYIRTSDSETRAAELRLCEKVVNEYFIRKRYVHVDILSHENLFDSIAEANSELRLYFLHPVELWVQQAVQYKNYESIVKTLTDEWGAVEVIENEITYHVVTTTVEYIRAASILSSTVSKLRMLFICYRGKKYKYTAFKQSLYLYQIQEIARPDDFLQKPED